ncbi:MAG: L-lactate dehydrogenase [Clostridia bacterium]|nr:L-lactate dehydrogenase [Clostridia bacterium]
MGKGKSKVAIIGAGFVGSASAYAIALRQVCTELVLIDVAEDKARGEADDIKHGLPFIGQMKVYSGGYECVKDCDVIVVTAGANRKPGETRLDLAKKNAFIGKSIADSIMQHYNGGVILVVANPVDILTYLFAKWTGLPAGRVLGSGTSLDTIRLRSALADRTGIDISNIHGYIIGEHGDSQVPAWSNTHIAGMQIDDYCEKNNIELTEEIKEEIRQGVVTGGAKIIKRKGATYYGVAVCVATLVESLLRDSDTIRTVSTVMMGEFGVSDVALSLPAVIGSTGVKKVMQPTLTEEEIERFRASAEACKAVLADCQG